MSAQLLFQPSLIIITHHHSSFIIIITPDPKNKGPKAGNVDERASLRLAVRACALASVGVSFWCREHRGSH
jgi:hypothetical protein